MTIAAARTHEYHAAHATTTLEARNRSKTKFLQCRRLQHATVKGEPRNPHLTSLTIRQKQAAGGLLVAHCS